MKCARCQHQNEDGARFCEECAAPLALVCVNCGRPLFPMAKFCPGCAHPTDHAVRACYAALRMQDAVRRYSDELRRAQGVEVQIRVGLNSGEVVVRSIGSDFRMDYTAVGYRSA